jgi:hypothetical protein
MKAKGICGGFTSRESTETGRWRRKRVAVEAEANPAWDKVDQPQPRLAAPPKEEEDEGGRRPRP